MEKDSIDNAIESADPLAAEEAFHQIESRLSLAADAASRAGLLLSKAVLLGRLHRFDEARKQLELASQQTPNDDPGFQLSLEFIASSMYDEEGRPGEALVRLTAVWSKHNEQLNVREFRSIYEDIQLRRAFDSVKVGEWRNAIPLLRECLSFDMKLGERISVLSNLGICSVKLKQYEDARDYLLQACKEGVTSEWQGHVHFYLALSYAHLKLLQESKREFQRCEEHAAEYQLPLAQVYAWLSKICKELGEKDDSERYSRMARPI